MIYLIAPYRDRPKHFELFLENYLSLLHDKEVKIIIIEQANNKPFNKGLLLNSGIKTIGEKLVINDEDIIILNDIDCLIKPHKIDYLLESPNDNVRHIYGYNRIFYNCFDCLGGIVSMKFKTFKLINGFPNNFWGWGGEDLALGWRTKYHKKNIVKSDMIVYGNTRDISHLVNPEINKKLNKKSTNLINVKKLMIETINPRLVYYNGYNNCIYYQKEFIENEKYIHIKLDF